MGRWTAIRVALAALLLAASAACSPSNADKAGPTATVATEPPTTTTTNPYAVPAVIDVAYVNRVLAGLDAAMGDVTRLVLRTKTIPQEAYDRLRSIYGNDQRLQLAIDNIQTDIRRRFADYRPEPGNKVTTILQLISTSPTCIFARVSRDYTQVGLNSRSADIQWIAIKPLDPARNQSGHNFTNWAYDYEGYPPDRSQPDNPCVG